MSIYLGNTEIGQIYLGSTEIGQIYLGNTKVYEAGGEPPTPPPYDAEVEYLQSSATQYINTGVNITPDFKCEVRGLFTSNRKRNDNLLGCTDDQLYGFGIPCAINSSGNFYAQFGNALTAVGTSGLVLTTIITTLQNGNCTIECDGSVLSSISIGTQIPTNTLYMFARNYNNSPSGQANAKIYYCKLWENGVLVRNFVPVRVGTTGYMYDRVSGQLFGNEGSGIFTYGNDIN